MSSARRRPRQLTALCKKLGIDAELLRWSKHPIYQLTNRYGATMRYTVPGTPSDVRGIKNRRRDLERFSKERP